MQSEKLSDGLRTAYFGNLLRLLKNKSLMYIGKEYWQVGCDAALDQNLIYCHAAKHCSKQATY